MIEAKIRGCAPIDQCPHCGSDYGYYTKDYIRGSIRYICGFDGTERDNTDMYDFATHSAGKQAYCVECGKYLFDMSEVDVK